MLGCSFKTIVSNLAFVVMIVFHSLICISSTGAVAQIFSPGGGAGSGLAS